MTETLGGIGNFKRSIVNDTFLYNLLCILNFGYCEVHFIFFTLLNFVRKEKNKWNQSINDVPSVSAICWINGRVPGDVIRHEIEYWCLRYHTFLKPNFRGMLIKFADIILDSGKLTDKLLFPNPVYKHVVREVKSCMQYCSRLELSLMKMKFGFIHNISISASWCLVNRLIYHVL